MLISGVFKEEIGATVISFVQVCNGANSSLTLRDWVILNGSCGCRWQQPVQVLTHGPRALAWSDDRRVRAFIYMPNINLRWPWHRQPLCAVLRSSYELAELSPWHFTDSTVNTVLSMVLLWTLADGRSPRPCCFLSAHICWCKPSSASLLLLYHHHHQQQQQHAWCQ